MIRPHCRLESAAEISGMVDMDGFGAVNAMAAGCNAELSCANTMTRRRRRMRDLIASAGDLGGCSCSIAECQ